MTNWWVEIHGPNRINELLVARLAVARYHPNGKTRTSNKIGDAEQRPIFLGTPHQIPCSVALAAVIREGFSSFSASRKHTPTLFVGGVYYPFVSQKGRCCSLMLASSSSC